MLKFHLMKKDRLNSDPSPQCMLGFRVHAFLFIPQRCFDIYVLWGSDKKTHGNLCSMVQGFPHSLVVRP